ncbi:hypothetical protein ANANG_G00296640 [Anguilla anguilla]|uniref:Uncharacterized protein n=1 Tax=Anguilla anguilla TaxID=7936 RepID=A0A9D3RJN9_ANGAN|nr:hypothetical protein ANANG_G00296640 [Anguilla anguilla]
MRVLSRLALVLKDARTLSFLRDVLCEFVGTALFLFAGLASVVLWQGAPGSEGAPVPTRRRRRLGGVRPGVPLRVPPRPAPRRPRLRDRPRPRLAVPGAGHLRRGPPQPRGHPGDGRRAAAGDPGGPSLYVGAQLLGALCACTLLRGLKPTPLPGPMGLNELGPGVCPYQALSVEAAVTFLLVLCVAVAARPKSPFGRLGPAAVGLSVVLGHLVAMGLTGCGMNPARSFGPAVMAQDFHNHWVYWAGPCAGAVLAVAVHDLLLHPRWGCPATGWRS